MLERFFFLAEKYGNRIFAFVHIKDTVFVESTFQFIEKAVIINPIQGHQIRLGEELYNFLPGYRFDVYGGEFIPDGTE